MHFGYEQLLQGSRNEISRDSDRHRDGGVLRVVVGVGRGCVLYGKAAPVTVLVPLKGRVSLSDGATHHTGTLGQLLIVEGGRNVQVIGPGLSLWIAVLTNARAWRELTRAGLSTHASDPVLLPGLHEADRLIRRGVIALARTVRSERASCSATFASAASIATAISDLQSEYDDLIERCPGRTWSQRRSVFLRLHRVRNLMMSSCHSALDLADCARIASYSPCHFIRAFSAVFGETPHALLVEQRLRQAHRLLNTSVLAIAEVARISGFEDRCAFARSFKRRFGMTATDLRDERNASLQATAA